MNEETKEETRRPEPEDDLPNPLLPDPNLTYQEYICRRIVLSGQLFGDVDVPEHPS